MKKPWLTFFAKLSEYKTLPLLEWTEYQFLGFALAQLKENDNSFSVAPNNNEPRRHPGLQSMRMVALKLERTIHNCQAIYAIGSAHWDKPLLHEYLTWQIQRAKKRGVKITSLSYLYGDTAISIFANERRKQQVKETINRSTELPSHLVNCVAGVRNWGELSFAYQGEEYMREQVIASCSAEELAILGKVV
jgi:hypothetical protein